MAWRAAICMGFHLPENFRMPYISRAPSEHWQRWHMSLIRWIRDYLYIPLGGNRVSYWRHKLNVFLTMFLAGLWHGAAWTFVIWGGLHGIILTVETILRDVAERFRSRAKTDGAAIAGPSAADAREAGDAQAAGDLRTAEDLRTAGDERTAGDAPAPGDEAPIGPLGRIVRTPRALVGRMRHLLRFPGRLAAFLLTSFFTVYLGTMFRSRNIADSWLILKRMAGLEVFAAPPLSPSMYRPVFLGVLCILVGHFLGYLIFEKKKDVRIPAWLEIALAPILILLFIQIGATGVTPFIYFVF